MSYSDIFEYADYTLVKDGYSKLYSVHLQDAVLADSLSLNDAIRFANSHHEKRIREASSCSYTDRANLPISLRRLYQVEGVVIRQNDSVGTYSKKVYAMNEDSAVDEVLTCFHKSYGYDCLLRDIRISCLEN